MRPFLGNLGLLALASVAALGIGEIFVRIAAPQELPLDPRRVHPRFLYAPHPRIGFTLNPAFRGEFRQAEFATQVACDSLGIRDREYGPRPPGTRRIVVLGDSYTFGWGVEAGERYVDRLEARLNDSGRDRWEVVKAGINAYGTREEGLWLAEYGWSLDPEVVLLEFCMGNDFADNLAPGYQVEDGYLVTIRAGSPASPASLLESMKRWARERSHLFVFLRDRLRWFRFGVGRSERTLALLREFNRSVDDGVPETVRFLRAMAEDARRRGVPLLAVIVPMRHQVYESRDVDREILEHPNRAARAACDSAGIPVFDLLPGFRARLAAGGPRLYFRVDRHWTPAGHRVAGDLLSEELARRGLVAVAAPEQGAREAAAAPARAPNH